MKILRAAKKVLVWLLTAFNWLLVHLSPVNPHLALFMAFHGKGYLDNPRAIYEEMRNDPRFADFSYVWVMKKPVPVPGAKVVKYLSWGYFWNMARAKYWIINSKLPSYIFKKKSQIYLQTWHGTPLKHLGHDIEVDENTTFYRSGQSYAQMTQSYDRDSARYTYMISPNAFCTEVFPHAFGVDKEKLREIGYPRNDILSNFTEEQVRAKKQELGVPEDKKVLLYAPTWRDNSYVAAGYTFRLKADLHKWKEKLGDEWVVLFKPHYLIINEFKEDPELEGFLYSIDAGADIAELYPVADALVTDYSSVFFDYAILNRPMWFYMYDLDEYAKDLRGFYFDIHKELPGRIYQDEDALLQAIADGDFDPERLARFNQRFNNREDGHASRRAVDLLAESR